MTDNRMIQAMEHDLPFWDKLTGTERETLINNSMIMSFKKDEMIHNSDDECRGVFLIISGQLRAYVLSEDGREVTLYRLYKNDVCVLSASCVLDSIAFDVFIESIEKTEAVFIPLTVYHKLMNENIHVELFTYKESTSRFSDVMWTMQQILFMGADKRIAYFLYEEMNSTHSDTINFTHDRIARYIGSAREVVSRMLKYFSDEGIVSLSRGKIKILDKKKLSAYL